MAGMHVTRSHAVTYLLIIVWIMDGEIFIAFWDMIFLQIIMSFFRFTLLCFLNRF